MFFVDRPSAIEHCGIVLKVAKSVANVAHVPENAPLLYSLKWISADFEGVHSTCYGLATLLMVFVDRLSAIEHSGIVLRVAKSVANVAHVPENAPLLYSLKWISDAFEKVYSTCYRYSHPFDGFC